MLVEFNAPVNLQCLDSRSRLRLKAGPLAGLVEDRDPSPLKVGHLIAIKLAVPVQDFIGEAMQRFSWGEALHGHT